MYSEGGSSSSGVKCGVRPMSNRIIGGRGATAHSWPWQCSLQNASHVHMCGCSIISPNYVITAAHCKYVHLHSLLHALSFLAYVYLRHFACSNWLLLVGNSVTISCMHEFKGEANILWNTRNSEQSLLVETISGQTIIKFS